MPPGGQNSRAFKVEEAQGEKQQPMQDGFVMTWQQKAAWPVFAEWG